MEKYEGSTTSVVADVDCTGAGDQLCKTVKVDGYPTIKWGDPEEMQDHDGGRSFEELEAFAEEHLKPLCSPTNLDLCEPKPRKVLEKYLKMSDAKLDKEIAKKEAESEAAEDYFVEEVSRLKDKYEQFEKIKADKQGVIQASGLAVMKEVKAYNDLESMIDDL